MWCRRCLLGALLLYAFGLWACEADQKIIYIVEPTPTAGAAPAPSDDPRSTPPLPEDAVEPVDLVSEGGDIDLRPPAPAPTALPTGAPSPSAAPSPTAGDPCFEAELDPRAKRLHRLNRAEYDNTVRELFRTLASPSRDFPADDHGYGFDNIASVLSVSPLLVEKYQFAAEQLIAEALFQEGAEPELFAFEAEDLGGSGGADAGSAWNLYTNGTVRASLVAPTAGEYEIRVRAWGQQAGPDPARMTVEVNDQVLQTFDVTAVPGAGRVYSFRTDLLAGPTLVDANFINDYYNPSANDPADRDRNLLIDWIEVEGPLDLPPPTSSASRAAIMICEPGELTADACAERILGHFAERAWRRPVNDREKERLVELSAAALTRGGDFQESIEVGLQAILLSPHFLFRVELDPPEAGARAHRLDDFELATRLSYFLWSSMPDATLMAVARAGRLQDDTELIAQVRRMLRDPRSRALVDNFAGQWLMLRSVADLDPDYEKYADFDESLREAMKTETELLFEAFLQEDRPIVDMLDADFTFVNARLAEHYGLPAPSGPGFERVYPDQEELTTARGGLLRQASLLSVTSNRTRTSPVKRGFWVTANLLCQEPPEPPEGIPAFPEEPDPDASSRERFEQHRADPSCAVCHTLMDPIGFGLEHYDAIGAWRDEDEGHAIDATGELPGGTTFDGARELATALKTWPTLIPCVLERVSAYALGRGLDARDHCATEAIEREFLAAGGSFEDLVLAIVRSELFRSRRAETPPDEGGLE